MKVMSFNTQHCNNYRTQTIDFDVMAKTILAFDPDMVGLNEMRGAGADPAYTAQAEKLAELTGMPYFHFAPAIQLAEGPYGNAFLSKVPIKSVETVMIPDIEDKSDAPYFETRCILKAALANGLTVLVTHMGLSDGEQHSAVGTVLKTLTDEKCILMGDFNTTPDDQKLAPLYEKMQDTAVCFDAPKLSFPSDNPDRKIDYIFVSKDIKVLSADIPAVVASDHRPYVAELEI